MDGRRSACSTPGVARAYRLLLPLLVGCGGPTGPELPSDVGFSHAERQTEGGEAQPPARPSEVGPGLRVWANLGATGIYGLGTVTETEGKRARVVYADGEGRWLDEEGLYEDRLAEGDEVNVREAIGGEYDRRATVVRRLHDAVFLRYGNGDEAWTSVAQVALWVHPRAEEPVHDPPAPGPGQPGSTVVVDYGHQGLGFLATITALEGPRAHVVYLDGVSEWVAASQLLPDRVGIGTTVHVRIRWEPADWLRGEVVERMGDAVRVRFDDGRHTWTARSRLRVPVDELPAPDESPTIEDDPPGSAALAPDLTPPAGSPPCPWPCARRGRGWRGGPRPAGRSPRRAAAACPPRPSDRAG